MIKRNKSNFTGEKVVRQAKCNKARRIQNESNSYQEIRLLEFELAEKYAKKSKSQQRKHEKIARKTTPSGYHMPYGTRGNSATKTQTARTRKAATK